MSMLSVHLGRRMVESGDHAAGTSMTLAELGRGRTARIVGVCDNADPASARRLFDLGFVPGTDVEVLRRAPMADPVVFRIAGYEVALRRAQARCIRVCTTQ